MQPIPTIVLSNSEQQGPEEAMQFDHNTLPLLWEKYYLDHKAKATKPWYI
jgi:hypothetical protein